MRTYTDRRAVGPRAGTPCPRPRRPSRAAAVNDIDIQTPFPPSIRVGSSLQIPKLLISPLPPLRDVVAAGFSEGVLRGQHRACAVSRIGIPPLIAVRPFRTLWGSIMLRKPRARY